MGIWPEEEAGGGGEMSGGPLIPYYRLRVQDVGLYNVNGMAVYSIHRNKVSIDSVSYRLGYV